MSNLIVKCFINMLSLLHLFLFDSEFFWQNMISLVSFLLFNDLSFFFFYLLAPVFCNIFAGFLPFSNLLLHTSLVVKVFFMLTLYIVNN